jgi:hypothetical protein
MFEYFSLNLFYPRFDICLCIGTGYVGNTFQKADGASSCRNLLSDAYKDTGDLFITQLADDDDIRKYLNECQPEPEIRLSDYAPAMPPSAIFNNKRDTADEPLNGDLERLVRRSHAENIRRMNCIRIFQNSGQLIAKCLQDRMMGTVQFQGEY